MLLGEYPRPQTSLHLISEKDYMFQSLSDARSCQQSFIGWWCTIFLHFQDDDPATLGIDISVPHCCDKFPARIYHRARTPGGNFHIRPCTRFRVPAKKIKMQTIQEVYHLICGMVTKMIKFTRLFFILGKSQHIICLVLSYWYCTNLREQITEFTNLLASKKLNFQSGILGASLTFPAPYDMFSA